MHLDKTLEAWLYPSLPASHFPQRIFAGPKKNVLAWLPGNKPFIPPTPEKVALIGYTGKSFPAAVETQEGSFALHWLGVDLDDIVELLEASRLISSLLPHASIRVSTGGHGLHLITRIKPVTLSGNASGFVKAIQTPWVETLLKAGIAVCKFDSRVFFLSGGRNEWLYQTEEIYTTPADLTPTISELPATGRGKTYRWVDLSPRVQNFLKAVAAPRRHLATYPEYLDVYIKNLFQKLAGGIYAFKTKSKMASSTPHTNGYIRVSPCYACLKAFADERPALEIFDFLSETEKGDESSEI